MTAFAQTSTGDLALTNGQLVVVTDPNTVAAQKLVNRLNLAKGEWYRDQRVGVPYFEFFFIKNPDLGVVKQILREVIVETPGIAQLLDLVLNFDRAQRVLTYTFRAQTDSGAVISGGSGVPFIVELNQ